MQFKKWLENYQNVDPENEKTLVSKMSMTRQLPIAKDIFASIRGLTRGFHLNTIISRMFQPWLVGFEYAPVKYESDNPYEYRISKEDKRANNKYKGAYAIFKQEIANAVAALPYKEGLDKRSGKYADVMLASKEFLQNLETEEKDMLNSLAAAFRISVAVFGERTEQPRNFMNFLQIVRDEFMKLGETLPTMGEDDMEELTSPYIKILDQEIAKYRQIVDRI